MNADIRIPGSRFDLHLRAQRLGRSNLCINRVVLRQSGTGERERNLVVCRIARVQTSRASGRARRRHIVLMDGKPMVVFTMIVIRVSVGMRREGHA